jgi:hypothetical protein
LIPQSTKPIRPKRCRVAGCGATFTPTRSFQKWCSPDCAVVLARQAQEKQRKSFAQRERREIKLRKEKLKSRAEHLKDTQQAFNAWVRERDALLPCVSCGRHHEGQWHAGHYRTVSAHPAIRFEPLNVWKQCAPCNTHKSGDLLNYRAELIRRIGEEKVLWLEGPHEPMKYTINDLKAMTAHYRAMTRELKRGEVA